MTASTKRALSCASVAVRTSSAGQTDVAQQAIAGPVAAHSEAIHLVAYALLVEVWHTE